MALLGQSNCRQTLTDETLVDRKLGELEDGLGVLGGFDLGGGVDVRHGRRLGRGEVRGRGGY